MATQNQPTSAPASTATHNKIDYQKEITKCEDFLTRFEKTEQYGRKYVYMDKLVTLIVV